MIDHQEPQMINRCQDTAPALAEQTNFETLLEQAGFRVHGTRAECPYCEGTSRLTVRIGPGPVFFCHRCKKSGNARTLSRELKISLAPESRAVRDRRVRERFFEQWRGACQLDLLDELYKLTLKAECAKQTLPLLAHHDALAEIEWQALADLYHRQADILAALDTLCFEKLSPWLESPMTRAKLFLAFGAEVSR
jgi:hypothetical protein